MAEDANVPGWRLAQIRPNCLHIAERNLIRQGFSVFCPRYPETRRRAGRFVSIEAPLFPGYVFVSIDPASSPWRVINSTYGVAKLVSFGTHAPTEVPHQLVQGLMSRCDERGLLLPPDAMKEGDDVQILSGPFAEFVAKVEKIASDKRVWLLLDLLGGQTRVAIDVDKLRKL